MSKLEEFLTEFSGIQALRLKHVLEVVARFGSREGKRHEILEELATLNRQARMWINHEGKVSLNVPSFDDKRNSFEVSKTEFDYFNFCNNLSPIIPKTPETLSMTAKEEKQWRRNAIKHGEMKTMAYGTYWFNSFRREWVHTLLEQKGKAA